MKKYKKTQSKLKQMPSGLNPELKAAMSGERQGVSPTVGMLNVARAKALKEQAAIEASEKEGAAVPAAAAA